MTTSVKTTPVRCKETQKRLARKDERGIWLYCRECRDEHFYLWSELLPTSAEQRLPDDPQQQA